MATIYQAYPQGLQQYGAYGASPYYIGGVPNPAFIYPAIPMPIEIVQPVAKPRSEFSDDEIELAEKIMEECDAQRTS